VRQKGWTGEKLYQRIAHDVFHGRAGETLRAAFILWVLEDGRQTIAFIDPHGLGRARGLSDPKIQLHRRLAEMQPALQRHCRRWRVMLTSFIVSPTAYDAARRSSWIADHSADALAAEHVLFQGGEDYIRRLWTALSPAP
jgi:hypothetical protein